ncbi:efflux RND transporter periplasmic adaptor subunit [Microvirga guangxiensis]|uniref:Membrane fusion protein, multidrug efflux system n=1 Tax=Microvirga guangxiensis TaxID=549386 RepID=A0A1G5JZG0_9HYPH|nr:efflux RND transporter periplasmic adaptor subunit [Microvirga guangxiensis]SCY93250.1 membrane fusion protein, multidrug efflux system [Microvirga guangxiensis]
MPPPQVTVAEIKAKAVTVIYEYAARISAHREVQVRARVGGILLKRNFNEGSTVKAGQVLFEIDPAPFEAELARAKAQLQQAQAQYNQAVRDAERALQLFAKGAGSEKARDDALSAKELGAAAVAAAEAQVRTAQLNLDYTKVKAPISGITSLEQVPEGSLIGTSGDSGLLTSITELDPVYVNFSFADREGAEIRRLLDAQSSKGSPSTNLKVRITFGDGQVYDQEGTIDFTSSSIDTETGTLQARAVVKNPDRRLVPGQFVRAAVDGLILSDAIVVPEAAVMQGPQGQFVYAVNASGQAEVRPVQLGRQVEGGWIAASGLRLGDKIVTEGVIKVRPGAPVTASMASASSNTNVAVK